MEMSRLEMIDVIRERTGLGYKEAADLLDGANGDLIEALARHEQSEKDRKPAWVSAGQGAFDRIKELVQEGNVTRVRVKRGERTLLELPVTAGVVGALIAPELAVLGGALCLFTRCTIELERADGSVDVHDLTTGEPR